MRELKFRAWHKSLKKMFYNARVSSDSWTTDDTHFGGSHETLMQFTGLKDKNGKEIYEGDIVKFGKKLDRFGEIKFGVCCFMLRQLDKKFSMPPALGEAVERKEIEVIGNIYENPELLKAK